MKNKAGEFIILMAAKSAKFFNVRELQRHQFKQAVKKKNNEEILKLQTN